MNVRPSQTTAAGPLTASAGAIRRGARSGRELDFHGLIRTLWLNKWTMAAVMVVFMGLGTWWVIKATPRFTADAQVVLEVESAGAADLEAMVSGFSSATEALNTEMLVLQSRGLLDKLVATLDLESDPEFNPDLREPTLIAQAKQGLKSLLGIEIEPRSELQIRQDAIELLRDRLSIRNMLDSYVFQIAVETESRTKSALIANTLAKLYIERTMDVKFESIKQTNDWLKEQVLVLQRDLENAEIAVADFRSSTSLISEEALALATLRMKELRERLAETMRNLDEGRQALTEAESLFDGGDLAGAATALEDQRLVQLGARIDAMGDPAARSTAEGEFATSFTRAMERLRARVATDQRQINVLETSIAEIENRLNEQSDDLVVLRQLTREAAANQALYEHFLARMKEMQLQEGTQSAEASVLSSAVPPQFPSYPSRIKTIALSGILGLIFGGVLVVLRETGGRSVRAPEDLETFTDLPVMGTVPEVRQKSPLQYVKEQPASVLAEAVRNLRTSLFLSAVSRPPQVIMMTSSVPAEGKSSTLLMLAQISVSLGKRVLIVECDIRRSVFSKEFNGSERNGILNALDRDRDIEDVILHDERYGVDVILGQRSSANAADVFSSELFHDFMAEMRERYDLIFIDTPPVLAVPDARIIAAAADAVLYAVRWDSTTKDQVQAGLTLLEQSKTPVSGLVLTRTNPKKMGRYGYYGYGYGDKSSGKYYVN